MRVQRVELLHSVSERQIERQAIQRDRHVTQLVAVNLDVRALARQAADVLNASREREDKEGKSRVRYARGELSLDVNNMRAKLAEKGLKYIDTPPED